MVKDIQMVCTHEPDATIGAFHLPNEHPYSLFHSIQCAVVCAFIMQDEGFSEQEQKMIIAASLTANVGMHALQEQLAKQDGMLTPDQDDEVKLHPEKSVRLLQTIGVEDKTWLRTVLEHHERGDASGYPQSLTLDKISKGGLMLAIAIVMVPWYRYAIIVNRFSLRMR